MIDYYIKCASKREWETLQAQLLAANSFLGNPIQIDIDVIGLKYRPTGQQVVPLTLLDRAKNLIGFNIIAEPVDEMVAVSGWHVNVRASASIPGLEPYTLTPSNPIRVWA